MKLIQNLLLAMVASFTSAAAQDEKASEPTSPPFADTDTFIPAILEVPNFIPPTPLAREPLPDIQIDASVVLPTESGKILTLQRGEASTLPDLPDPPPPAPAQPVQPLTPGELARQINQHRHSFNLGGTVYNHQVSQIQWTNLETGKVYQAICGFDIGLLAGIGHFVHQGENYSINLIHSDVTTNHLRAKSPYSPEIPPGQFRITQGDSNNSDANEKLGILRDIIAAEKERLLIYQAERLEKQRESAAWANSHPPVPHDETIILRPHRGSRYLADPQPETKGETTR